MPKRHHKDSIGWPIVETINENYRGYPKYIHYDFTHSSEYLIFDIPHGNGYSIATHTFLVCTPTQILAQYTYTFSDFEGTIEPLYCAIDGYFGAFLKPRRCTLCIFRYDSSTQSISLYRSQTTSYNFPKPDVYAYKLNDVNYFSLGKCNTRETPGMYRVSDGLWSVSETNGRTYRVMLSHNYSSAYPYLSLLIHVHGYGAVIVKSANNYGFGFSSDTSLSLSNCVAVSNTAAITSCSQYPIFGRNWYINGNKRLFGAGAHPIIISDDYTQLSIDNSDTWEGGGRFFISDNKFYAWTGSPNYDLYLVTHQS